MKRDTLLSLRAIDSAVHRLESAAPDGLSPLQLQAFDRRRFLSVGASSLAAALLAGCGLAGNDRAERVLAYASKKNETVERWLLRHTSMNHVTPGSITAGNKFPTYFISDIVPMWDASKSDWALEVTGLVKTPLRLDLAALMALPRTQQRVDHFCVEGWNAVAGFTGVRVSELARLAGALPQAQYVDFRSFDDGYHESWDMESALHPQTLVVYGKDGQALTPPFGAPARVQSPVKLGYKNTKYLTSLVFMAERNGGYWTDNGYEWYGGT